MRWPTVMTALVTPYDAQGEIAPQKAAELALHLWGQGSGGFVVGGSTGEAFALSLPEREEVFRAIKHALPHDVPVWVGTGHNDTRQTIQWTEAADSWGADGLLIVAPYYNKPSQEGLIHHFVEVARHTEKPVMIYNVPGRTGVSVQPDTVLRAHRLAPNLVAVKEAAGSILSVIQMHRLLADEMVIYSGDDGLLLPSLAVGAVGVVSVASHLVARQMAEMVQLYQSGNTLEALRYHEALWPLAQALFVDSNPVPLKWLLNALGWDVGGVRPPLVMAPDEHYEAVRRAYDTIEPWHEPAEKA